MRGASWQKQQRENLKLAFGKSRWKMVSEVTVRVLCEAGRVIQGTAVRPGRQVVEVEESKLYSLLLSTLRTFQDEILPASRCWAERYWVFSAKIPQDNLVFGPQKLIKGSPLQDVCVRPRSPVTPPDSSFSPHCALSLARAESPRLAMNCSPKASHLRHHIS